jgi:hypothetical protein
MFRAQEHPHARHRLPLGRHKSPANIGVVQPRPLQRMARRWRLGEGN